MRNMLYFHHLDTQAIFPLLYKPLVRKVIKMDKTSELYNNINKENQANFTRHFWAIFSTKSGQLYKKAFETLKEARTFLQENSRTHRGYATIVFGSMANVELDIIG